ncbi:HAD family hydrolase [Synechococcus sp. HK05]|uniref:HAD family hydrolase n=1 Tax=Synechococcus sp. HK05 TaxID=2725975 RepID=UPI001C38BF72|nr:HAD family hydrolase [Synechococcus sp. HK05]MBV2352096.1 HAD family hydrolase [Synechococcus sp. HK05]
MPISATPLKNRQTAVLFDLDGTLVNSSAGILASLDYAFRANGTSPIAALTDLMVGPPLHEIVESLCPEILPSGIDMIIESFKAHYDSIGYLQTTPYDGINQMLNRLLDAGIILAIVTNKRAHPTELILDQLGWNDCFSYVYCPDSFQPTPSHRKSGLLRKIMHDNGINPPDCVYVGDRKEDWHSARANNIRFGWVEWGYCIQKPDFDDNSFVLTVPDEEIILDAIWNAPELRRESLDGGGKLNQ